MNQVTQESKDKVTKILAIVGFIAIIIFGVFLAVRVVQLVPNAFSSLASIADGVYNTRIQSGLTVVVDKNIVNNGDSITVNWTGTSRNGTYAFSYECASGITLDMSGADGVVAPLNCGTETNVGSALKLKLIAHSNKQRFIDVSYMVTFTNAGAVGTFFEKTGQFTVVNAEIPQSISGVVIGEESDDEETETEGVVAGEATGTETINTQVSTPPATTQPVAVTSPITIAVPIISDPNGFTDLRVMYLGVGHLENGNSFNPDATIDNDRQGAFRFSVKNIGTKTSNDWSFVATLPSGIEFTSDNQIELKPSEQATITLGFNSVGDVGLQDIGAIITTTGDINTSNNSFEWTVEIVD